MSKITEQKRSPDTIKISEGIATAMAAVVVQRQEALEKYANAINELIKAACDQIGADPREYVLERNPTNGRFVLRKEERLSDPLVDSKEGSNIDGATDSDT